MYTSRQLKLLCLLSLFLADTITDIVCIAEWYKISNSTWYTISISIVSFSFFIQWLYCLRNCNLSLKYINIYKHVGWKSINYYLNFYSTHYPCMHRNENVSQSNQNKLRIKKHIRNDSQSISSSKYISKYKQYLILFMYFIFTNILHLIFQYGIIQAFIKNWYILQKYSINHNNDDEQQNKNIHFSFDIRNNFNSVENENEHKFQFIDNFLCSTFIDLCVLHIFFQSCFMAVMNIAFIFSQMLSVSIVSSSH